MQEQMFFRVGIWADSRLGSNVPNEPRGYTLDSSGVSDLINEMNNRSKDAIAIWGQSGALELLPKSAIKHIEFYSGFMADPEATSCHTIVRAVTPETAKMMLSPGSEEGAKCTTTK